MTHHINGFMKAGIAIAHTFDEAGLREPPEVTLWFKTEIARTNYLVWLYNEFKDVLLFSYVAGDSPYKFKNFTFMGVKYILEVEPE